MINAFLPIASVQSLGFAADMRLALRSGSFNHGDTSDPLYLTHQGLLDQGLLDQPPLDQPPLDRLSLLGLFLLRLRLRLAQRFGLFEFGLFEVGMFGIQAGQLEQPEGTSFRQRGRTRCQLFTGSTAC